MNYLPPQSRRPDFPMTRDYPPPRPRRTELKYNMWRLDKVTNQWVFIGQIAASQIQEYLISEPQTIHLQPVPVLG